MEIISHQRFGEWVCKSFAGVYLPHLHKCFDKIIPNKMVAQRHVFLFRMLPVFVAFNNKLMLLINTGMGLDTLILINLRWYRSIIESSRAFCSAVYLAPNVEVCTVV